MSPELIAQVIGFIILGGLLIMVEFQNRSLQRQVTEQREVGHADRISLAQKDQIIVLQAVEIAALRQLTNEAVESKQVVESMNRILVDEYLKKARAAEKRRETLSQRREG